MFRRLALSALVFAAMPALACRARYCEPGRSFDRTLREASFVAIGTVVDGQLEIDRRWKSPDPDVWRVRVAFDAYRCCNLYALAEEGSRWLIVSRRYPPQALMSERSRLLRETSNDEAELSARIARVLGTGAAYPHGPMTSDAWMPQAKASSPAPLLEIPERPGAR